MKLEHSGLFCCFVFFPVFSFYRLQRCWAVFVLSLDDAEEMMQMALVEANVLLRERLPEEIVDGIARWLSPTQWRHVRVPLLLDDACTVGEMRRVCRVPSSLEAFDPLSQCWLDTDKVITSREVFFMPRRTAIRYEILPAGVRGEKRFPSEFTFAQVGEDLQSSLGFRSGSLSLSIDAREMICGFENVLLTAMLNK